jgi:hypothetical protein
VELGRRREGVAATSELRRSRRRAGEREQRKRARAPVGGGESICVPWRTGDQAERATDGEAGRGGSGERRIGARAVPAKGSWGLGWFGSRSWRRRWRSNWPSEFEATASARCCEEDDVAMQREGEGVRSVCDYVCL